jgi:hypothetical protein
MLRRAEVYGFRDQPGARDNRFPRREAHVKRIPWSSRKGTESSLEGKQTLNELQREQRETGPQSFACLPKPVTSVRNRPTLSRLGGMPAQAASRQRARRHPGAGLHQGARFASGEGIQIRKRGKALRQPCDRRYR